MSKYMFAAFCNVGALGLIALGCHGCSQGHNVWGWAILMGWLMVKVPSDG